MTDSILCAGVSAVGWSDSGPPNRNCGLAIKMTPQKLHTNTRSISATEMAKRILTPNKNFLDGERLLEKYRP